MLRNDLLTGYREKSVTVDAEDQRGHCRSRESLLHGSTTARHVMRTHGLHEGDVTVGVEAARELVAVEVEVAFDRVASAFAPRADVTLPRALKSFIQFVGGAVVDER